MGDVLDLNSSINQESQYVDVPEGEYDARIDHVESGVCQWANEYNGNPNRMVYVNLAMPDGSEAQLRDEFVLNSDFEWKLSQLFLGTGQKKKGEPLPNLGRALNDLPGLTCRVRVKKTKGKGDKKDTTYTNITFLEKKQPKWGGGF
ncbi:MAG: hypothetical protein J6S50_00505 [Oscillospiraceae bacterium]|nr:hypothetical protein [Oscillospiraceae bacterium]MBO7726982.1 hypothetical protein [Oscillospiraceae bacterium]